MPKPQWKAATARLSVAGRRDRFVVDGFASTAAPGLIIHVATDAPDRWTVTHRSSGLAVLRLCSDRDTAERAAITLGAAINFRRPRAVVVRDDVAREAARMVAETFDLECRGVSNAQV